VSEAREAESYPEPDQDFWDFVFTQDTPGLRRVRLYRLDYMHPIRASYQARPALSLTPSEYVKRNFAITTSGMNWAPVLRFCIEAVGADNIMFAIDYLRRGPAEDLLPQRRADLRHRGLRGAGLSEPKGAARPGLRSEERAAQRPPPQAARPARQRSEAPGGERTTEHEGGRVHRVRRARGAAHRAAAGSVAAGWVRHLEY
jgi:hypothetical protein